MSERERSDAGLMGFGYRMEHHFRATGTLWIDGKERRFNAVGNRIHRQSVRPLDAFRGHCWQAAVFPDGRAFGYIAYRNEDPDALTFELSGMVLAANANFVLRGDPGVPEMARQVVRRRLRLARTAPDTPPRDAAAPA